MPTADSHRRPRPLGTRNAFCAAAWIALWCLPHDSRAEEAFVEVRKVVPSPATVSRVGSTVDISGDWAVAGGARVFVLRRDQGGTDNWGVVTELVPSTGAQAGGFGTSVSILGDFIAVGAPNENLFGDFNVGAVYLFQKDQGGADNWGEIKRLTPNGGYIDGEKFGAAVAMGPDRVAVGVPQDSNGHGGTGEVQVFGRNGTAVNTWAHLATLTPSDGASGDSFGFRVAFDVITVAASSLGWPDKKAYVYEVATTLGPGDDPNTTEIKVPPQGDPDAAGTFGNGIALNGTTLAISNLWSVEIFDRNQGGSNNWGGVDTINGPNSSFGNQLDVYGGTLLVGNLSDSSARGKVTVYRPVTLRGTTTWEFAQDILASDGVAGDFFSSGVAVDLDTAIIGASEDDNTVNSSGSVYLYDEVPVADLEITNDDGKATLARGAATTYTIQVVNQSSDDLSGVTVTSVQQLGVLDAAMSSWTCAPDPGARGLTTCPASGTVAQFEAGVAVDIATGDSLTFLYEVHTEGFQPPATMVNVATVTPPAGFSDPTPSNNEATDTNTFTTEADLEVEAAPSTTTPAPGSTFVVTATVTSHGPSQGTGQLQIFLPAELSYVGSTLVGEVRQERGGSGPPCSEQSSRGGGPTVICTQGLSSGTSVTYEVELMVDGAFQGIAQSAWEAAFLSGTDPIGDNNSVNIDSFVGVSPIIFTDGFEGGNTIAWN